MYWALRCNFVLFCVGEDYVKYPVHATAIMQLLSCARCILADPMPCLGPDSVGLANVNGFPTRHQLSTSYTIQLSFRGSCKK